MTAREMRELGEWDWWVTFEGLRLHAATVEYDPNWEVQGNGKTACGRTAWLSIPGIFTRMCAERCRRCCSVMGFPQGTGSPKNDETCRPLVQQRLAAVETRLGLR